MSWDAAFRWLRQRHITAFEFVQASLMTWWGLSIYTAHTRHMDGSPLYSHMLQIAPWWAWVTASWAVPLMIVAFACTQWLPVLYLSLFWKAAYWSLVALMIWQVAHSWLTPSAFLALALGAAMRYADVRVAQDTDGW